MKCFVCFIGTTGFIGQQCECGQGVTPVIPENGVTNDGEQVTYNGENVVHTGD